MPPKARIEDLCFKGALSVLEPDQLRLLDHSSTTDIIWSYLCLLMNKANNAENRRACYDVYKRKRIIFQPFINQLLENYAAQSNNHQEDTLPSSSNGEKKIVEANNLTQANIPIRVCTRIEMHLSCFRCHSFMSGTMCRNE